MNDGVLKSKADPAKNMKGKKTNWVVWESRHGSNESARNRVGRKLTHIN